MEAEKKDCAPIVANEPQQQSADTPSSDPPAHDAEIVASSQQRHARRYERLGFTGDGGEYFRIWIVNLLLTICTLGIYSAWAKVRKTRYLYQNTRLLGHAFDFHGDPGAILRGRILALAMLVAYSWAFDFSQTAGLTTVALLLIGGPWLFMRAQQFRLRNSSWRGLRFGFACNLRNAYIAVLPVLIIWFSGTIVGLWIAQSPPTIVVLGLVPTLLIPWMHHRLKRFQHSHSHFGGMESSFTPAVGSFIWVYAKGVGIMIGIGFLSSFAMSFVVMAVRAAEESSHSASELTALIVGAAVALLVYTIIWPYYSVRLQKIVWRNTQLGPIEFDTHMRASELVGIVGKNIVLTLLTLGLYWPYASMALARYRLEHMEVAMPTDLNSASANEVYDDSATGEGAVDLFGLDIGL